MKRILLLVTLMLSGCFSVDQAGEDAERAINNNDFRLYKLPVRGDVIPGISVSERARAATLCDTRILEGAGDVIRDDEELQKHREITNYAEEYNKIVYEACQKKKQPLKQIDK